MDQPFSAGDTEVQPPVAVSQAMPSWRPETALEQRMDYRGAVEVVIDEEGRVASATIVRSIHPRYDPLLVEAARGWVYEPATRAGQPVRYRYTMLINLTRR